MTTRDRGNELSFDRQAGHFLRGGKPIELTAQQIEYMNSLIWFHEIPLAPGLATKAHHSPLKLGLPALFQIEEFDFNNKSVLDIGASSGFYSFWAEAHGASKVTVVDDLTQLWVGNSVLDFAREALGSKLEFYNMSVYDLTPKAVGGHDVVMFFGVLYHLVHPMLGLEKACSVCKSDFFLETHYIHTDSDLPVCLLYPDKEYFDDYTNWSAPNLAWLTKALEIQGFQTQAVQIVSSERVSIWAKRVRNHHTESSVLNPHRDTTYFNLGPKV